MRQTKTLAAQFDEFSSNIRRATANIRQSKRNCLMPKSSMIKIATYDDPILAHLARNQLQAAGVQAFLEGEHHVAMDWLISNAVGGIKLLVATDSRDEAIQILEQFHKTDAVPPSEANYSNSSDGAHCCPECSSLDTYREKLRRKLIFLSLLFLGIPLPFFSRRIICDACGHKWFSKQGIDS